MRFICQVALDESKFPGAKGQMAYIFMSDFEEYVDGTWEPDGGENAVIIQPAGDVKAPFVRTSPLDSGPTLQKYVSESGEPSLKPVNVEFAVDLIRESDPDLIPDSLLYALSESEYEEYAQKVGGNKIGGTPGFMQADEYPGDPKDWLLLLQLDSCSVPFDINFGDAGIGYAFINKNLTEARFLWQCA